MSQSAIKFTNVSVFYAGDVCTAQCVCFEIAVGECLAIVGESGSGKTTISRAALGLLPQGTRITGSIQIGETEIIGASEKTLRDLRGLVVGFVAQEPFSSFNPLTGIYKHIAEAWRVHHLTPPRSGIINALEKNGIIGAESAAFKYPHEWSGGMLQRAEIVAAKAHNPRLIIADEPTSALDASRADEILKSLRSTGAALLIVSHDMNLVARYATKIAVCYRGEIVEIGETRQVIENPRHSYTKILLNAVSSEKASAPSENQNEIVLEGKNLSRLYGSGETAVKAVISANLQLRAGEIVGICGESGCGKSTLLRLLATIETPSSGEIYFGGELAASGDSRKLLSKKTRSGFVMPIFQNPLASLNRRWTIWRTITEPLTAKHIGKKYSRSQRREIAKNILNDVGLAEIDLDAIPERLSVGQCQRVAIARALVAKPAVIVADEPTSALDAVVSKNVLRLLSEITAQGTAVVIVSHDEHLLNSFCHRVLRMHDGVLADKVD